MKSQLTPTNVRSPIMQSLVGIAACALLFSGCAGGSKLTHNAKGGVYLEEVTDWSFEASHPAIIDQQTMTKVVKGVYRTDGMSGSSKMSAGGSKPMRVFSDEDAEFLSPLLALNLAKAKPEQIVWFRASSSAGSGSEPTTGSLYVHKGSIYMTIGPGAKPTDFTPESAARIEPAPAYAASGAADAMTMIIDYHALATAPMPAALPIAKAAPITPIAPIIPAATIVAATPAKVEAVSASVGQEELLAQKLHDLRTAKDVLAKKDTEITMLRRESEWMKRELRNRDEEIRAMRSMPVYAKQAPKKSTAQATRNR
ncbi:MAG: hypothetical protein ABI980_13585 [Nitrospirota bacterium]